MGYTEAEYEVLAKYKATKHDTETVLIVKHRRNETEGSKDDHNYLALVISQSAALALSYRL